MITGATNEDIFVFLQKFYQEMQGFKQEMIEFKKETNQRFNEIDNRFNEVDNRFNEADKKLAYMESRLDNIEHYQLQNIREDLNFTKTTVMKLWEERDKVKLNLTRNLLIATGSISLAVALIVSFFTGKAITYMPRP